MTGRMTISFDKDCLEETVLILRAVAGDVEETVNASAEANFEEVLRLSAIVEQRLQSGHLFKLNSKLAVTEGANKTLVVLEPTERLRKHFAALRIRAFER